MKEPRFKKGDVVVLKSGGPKLTIDDILCKDPSIASMSNAYYCV